LTDANYILSHFYKHAHPHQRGRL